MPGAGGASCANAGAARRPNNIVAISPFILPSSNLRVLLLAFPADDPVLAVFENDALVGQLHADAIGLGKIASLTRQLSRGDKLFDFFVARGAASRVHTDQAKFLVVMVLENGKN